MVVVAVQMIVKTRIIRNYRLAKWLVFAVVDVKVEMEEEEEAATKMILLDIGTELPYSLLFQTARQL